MILSAIVIGKAASIYENGFATMTQNFGPETRGGGCSAQVIPRIIRSCIRTLRGRTS